MDKKDMPRRREAMELRIRRTMAALEKNNMSAYYAPESADAVRIVEELLYEGEMLSFDTKDLLRRQRNAGRKRRKSADAQRKV